MRGEYVLEKYINIREPQIYVYSRSLQIYNYSQCASQAHKSERTELQK